MYVNKRGRSLLAHISSEAGKMWGSVFFLRSQSSVWTPIHICRHGYKSGEWPQYMVNERYLLLPQMIAGRTTAPSTHPPCRKDIQYFTITSISCEP